MERNTFTIRFYIRNNRKKKYGYAPLYMRITVDGKRWDSSIKVGIDPNYWDSKRERALGDEKDSNLVNETIESTKFRIHKIKLGIEDERKLLTIEAIKNKFLDKVENPKLGSTLFRFNMSSP